MKKCQLNKEIKEILSLEEFSLVYWPRWRFHRLNFKYYVPNIVALSLSTENVFSLSRG